MIRRRFILLLLSLLTGILWAESAQAQATSTSLGPKETLLSWNFEDKTAGEVLPWYQASTEEEKKLASALATQALSATRLAKAVRIKWGAGTATFIAHLCHTDTPADDSAAAVTVRGDHATLKCNVPAMLPLFLVRSDGAWRVDVSAYARTLGEQMPSVIQYCNRCAEATDKIAAEITAGKYPAAEDAIDAVKKAFLVLDAE
jgi:hypothetical protein